MGLCRGKKSKLQLNNTTCISHLSYNNVKMLAILTLTFSLIYSLFICGFSLGLHHILAALITRIK